MSKKWLFNLAVVSMMLAGGCMSLKTNEATPALVTGGQQTKVKLEAAASELLFGRSVSFAEDAFTSDHTVTIERSSGRDSEGRLLNGREMEPTVISFSLWTQDNKCFMERSDTKKRAEVEGIQCRSVL